MARSNPHPCADDDGAHADLDLRARLPRELAPLGELAYDLWWSWQPGGADLFRDVDRALWERCGRNPVKLLRDAPLSCLAAAARDPALVARISALHAAWTRHRERPFARADVTTPERPIAFFCAEYGVHASLPIYSGGLGVLAGDVLKQASDDGLPMVAVGLFYRRGYFRQRLDRSGWQHEYWTESPPEDLPMRMELDAQGAPRLVHLRIRARDVAARIWHVDVGRVPLFLLDTDVPENDPASRWITSTLYISDREFRLMQYAVLAIGGVRALRAMGIDPAVFHLNEGHAALAAIELMREEREKGASPKDALESARRRVVFTTHTPVASGNERYRHAELAEVLPNLSTDMRIDASTFFELGRGKPDDDRDLFGVTELALRTSRSANAVSERHGEVTRGMWQHLWPGRDARGVPIGHVTNGVHLATWMAAPMRELLERHLGSDFASTDDASLLARVDDIPDAELWQVRGLLRERLVAYVREKSMYDRLARGEPLGYAEGAASTFDPHVLTVGFARRVASYKRLHLLIRDPGRALPLLHGPRSIQVLIAGRAHPADDEAKRLVQAIFALKDVEGAGARVVYLEDYDFAIARELVAGCDVWLNVPRPPLEASGTSGMKAALNGGLDVSVLDGWWAEAFEPSRNGWGIASASVTDAATQDARDAETLYGLLEHEVIPMFYERDAAGVPQRWVARMKASLRCVVGGFTTRRMLRAYTERVYGPLAR